MNRDPMTPTRPSDPAKVRAGHLGGIARWAKQRGDRAADMLRDEGARYVHSRIKTAVERIVKPDWRQDGDGSEWVRLDAVRAVIDDEEPASFSSEESEVAS